MQLLKLTEDQNQVVSTQEAIDDLANVAHPFKAHAKGLKSLFVRYAKTGTQDLTSEMFHEADKEEGIMEFKRGRLRVYCFLDGGRIVVLSHAIVKKSQKTDKRDVEKAKRLKDAYFSAKADGTLEIIEE